MIDEIKSPEAVHERNTCKSLYPWWIHDYGIIRIFHKKTETWGWRVSIMRKGMLVKKSFADIKYGGMQAAFEKAKVVRDQVLRDLPPYTMQEQRAILRKSNTSGQPGVALRMCGRQPKWIATTQRPDGTHVTRKFSVRVHGFMVAQCMANAARLDQLKKIDGYFIQGESALEPTLAALVGAKIPSNDDVRLTILPKPVQMCQAYRE